MTSSNVSRKKHWYLKPLILMQLKDKIDFSFTKDKKKFWFKIIWTILGFVALTALCYLLFFLVVFFKLFNYVQTLNFQAFLVLMTLVLLLAFFSCLANITSTLYFAKDNPVLLTMPVKNSTIFTSKMIVCFIYELFKNAFYIMPILVAYGLVMKLPFFYFLWIVFAVVFVTLFFVLICGLLSIPAMAITILLRKNRILEFIVLALVAGGIAFGVVTLILNIPTDIDLVRDWGEIYWKIQDFLTGFANIFAPIGFLLQLMTGTAYLSTGFTPFSVQNLITFAICVGVMIAAFLAIYYLSKPLFLKMASTPFEYRKKSNVKNRKNRKHAIFASASLQQSKRIFRSANLIYSILAVAIATPIAILLQNQIISAMATRMVGTYMGIAFNILIILLLMLTSSSIIASIFSREGQSSYLNKINPVPYAVPLSGKLVLNSIIGIVSIVVSTVVIELYVHIGFLNVFLLAISLIFVYLGHIFWSAELDVMNPQNRLYQTSGKPQKNLNENKSTLIAFLIAIIFALICYFLMLEGLDKVFVKTLFIGLAFCGIRLYLFLTKIKLYYKEKGI